MRLDETEVLTGAGSLIEKKLIRDIIFEEHRSYPTDSTSLLEAAGYRVFASSTAAGLYCEGSDSIVVFLGSLQG